MTDPNSLIKVYPKSSQGKKQNVYVPVANNKSKKHIAFVRFMLHNIHESNRGSGVGKFIINEIDEIRGVGQQIGYKVNVE